jgi:hypothetical protein
MLQMVTFFFVLDLIKRMSKVKKFLRELDKHMDKAAKMVTPHPEYKAVLKCLMVLLVLSILAKALCRSRLGRLPVMRQLCGAGSKGVIYVRRVGDSTANVLAHPVASVRRVIRHPVQAADAAARSLDPFRS